MQRLLVGLILFLTAAVAMLWVSHSDLADDVNAKASRRGSGSRARGSSDERLFGAEMRSMETQLKNMREQIAKLQSENGDLRTALDRVARMRAAATKRTSSGDRPRDDNEGNLASPGDKPGFQISDQDEEYFMALQKRVERRRRLAGMTRNLMRRVDRLVRNKEIAGMSNEERERVENVIAGYVEKNDDLVTRFVREPDEAVKELSPNDRRARLTEEREVISTETQRSLEGVIGAEAAGIVVERTVSRSSSVRRGFRRRKG